MLQVLGYIQTNNFSLKHINFNEHIDDTWMVLARTLTELKELRAYAKDMGLFFKTSSGYPSVNATHWKAIEIWDKLMKDEEIGIQEVGLVYSYIRNIQHGWRKTDNKRWSKITKISLTIDIYILTVDYKRNRDHGQRPWT